MVRYLVLGLLVAAVITGAVIGCGPRAEVAKDKIMKKLDSILGELDVKKKSIEMKMDTLRADTEKLVFQRARAEAKLNLMTEKRDAIKSTMDSLKGKLKKVSGYLEQAKSAEDGKIKIGEREISIAEFEKAATETIKDYEDEKKRLAAKDKAVELLGDSVNYLLAQEKTAKELMGQLKLKIEEIEIKKENVDTIKEARSFSGENKSINDQLASLEKEIDDLNIDLEATLKVEESKMKELTNSTSAVDEILKETPNLDSLGSKLDEILGDGE